MAKITTDDCKKALVEAWPAELQQDHPAESGNWKRVSKKGKKGEPIVRTFYHKALPLQAIVTEIDGAIASTVIKGLAHFNLDEESESEGLAQTLAMVEKNESWEFLKKYDLFKPEDFVFFVSDKPDELMGPETWFVLTPLAYWKRTGAQSDFQLDYIIDRHLPEDCGEMEEGTFVTDMPPEQLRAELLKRGFVQDPEFDECFADSQS